MRIYVPSAGRPDRVTTLHSLPADREVTLVVPSEQAESYQASVEGAGRGNRTRVEPCDAPRIRAKRNWIVREHVNRHGVDEPLLMLDDDLRFRERLEDGRYATADVLGVENMLREIERRLAQYAHVGISDEFMSNHNPRVAAESRRYNQVLGYAPALWPREVLDCPFRLEVNEEHDLHLRLASWGLPSLVLTEWTKGSKFYAEGGCSTWRTPEVELEAHEALARNFPDLVTVVPTRNSLSGHGIRVRWSRAVRK